MNKSIASVLTVAALAAVFGGCNYETPLVADGGVTAVDEALLGVWHAVPPAGKEEAAPQVALIQKFSDKAYLIQYPVQAKDSLYFRGYRVEIAGKPYLQILKKSGLAPVSCGPCFLKKSGLAPVSCGPCFLLGTLGSALANHPRPVRSPALPGLTFPHEVASPGLFLTAAKRGGKIACKARFRG